MVNFQQLFLMNHPQYSPPLISSRIFALIISLKTVIKITQQQSISILSYDHPITANTPDIPSIRKGSFCQLLRAVASLQPMLRIVGRPSPHIFCFLFDFYIINDRNLSISAEDDTTYHIFFDNMLLPYLKALESKIVILGSQSKSRNELMTAQGIKYKVIPSKFPEDLEHASYEHPKDYNMDTCRGKVQELRARFQAEGIDWDVLICGDTIVQHGGKIIEKPSDYAHCVQMVTALAGNTHRIYTAHTVLFNGKKHGEWVKEEWVTSAEVTFGEIPPEVIAEFAKQPEPYLHSGGYELTAMSGGFLKSINGSHSAVQGLDMHEICWSLIRGGKKLQWF